MASPPLSGNRSLDTAHPAFVTHVRQITAHVRECRADQCRCRPSGRRVALQIATERFPASRRAEARHGGTRQSLPLRAELGESRCLGPVDQDPTLPALAPEAVNRL
ncbi:hypothetical protein GCM10009678_74400 [Actinomadura kijaniata]